MTVNEDEGQQSLSLQGSLPTATTNPGPPDAPTTWAASSGDQSRGAVTTDFRITPGRAEHGDQHGGPPATSGSQSQFVPCPLCVPAGWQRGTSDAVRGNPQGLINRPSSARERTRIPRYTALGGTNRRTPQREGRDSAAGCNRRQEEGSQSETGLKRPQGNGKGFEAHKQSPEEGRDLKRPLRKGKYLDAHKQHPEEGRDSDAPAKSLDAPAKSSDAPAKSSDAPAKSSDAPANFCCLFVGALRPANHYGHLRAPAKRAQPFKTESKAAYQPDDKDEMARARHVETATSRKGLASRIPVNQDVKTDETDPLPSSREKRRGWSGLAARFHGGQKKLRSQHHGSELREKEAHRPETVSKKTDSEGMPFTVVIPREVADPKSLQHEGTPDLSSGTYGVGAGTLHETSAVQHKLQRDQAESFSLVRDDDLMVQAALKSHHFDGAPNNPEAAYLIPPSDDTRASQDLSPDRFGNRTDRMDSQQTQKHESFMSSLIHPQIVTNRAGPISNQFRKNKMSFVYQDPVPPDKTEDERDTLHFPSSLQSRMSSAKELMDKPGKETWSTNLDDECSLLVKEDKLNMTLKLDDEFRKQNIHVGPSHVHPPLIEEGRHSMISKSGFQSETILGLHTTTYSQANCASSSQSEKSKRSEAMPYSQDLMTVTADTTLPVQDPMPVAKDATPPSEDFMAGTTDTTLPSQNTKSMSMDTIVSSQDPISVTTNATQPLQNTMSVTMKTTPPSQDSLPVTTNTTPPLQDVVPVTTNTTSPLQGVLSITINTKRPLQGTLPVITNTTPPSKDAAPVASNTTSPLQDTLSVTTKTTPPSQDSLSVTTNTTLPLQDVVPVTTNTTPPSQDSMPITTSTMPPLQDSMAITTNTSSPLQDTMSVTTKTTLPSQDSMGFQQDPIQITTNTTTPSHNSKSIAKDATPLPQVSMSTITGATPPSHDSTSINTDATPPPQYSMPIITNATPPSCDFMSIITDATPHPQYSMPIITNATPPSRDFMSIITDTTPSSHDSMSIITDATPPPQHPMPIITEIITDTTSPSQHSMPIHTGATHPSQHSTPIITEIITDAIPPPQHSMPIITEIITDTTPLPQHSMSIITEIITDTTSPPQHSMPIITDATSPPQDSMPVITDTTYPPQHSMPIITEIITDTTSPPQHSMPIITDATSPPQDSMPVITDTTYPPQHSMPIITEIITDTTSLPQHSMPIITDATSPPQDSMPVITDTTYPPQHSMPIITEIITDTTSPPQHSMPIITDTTPFPQDLTSITISTTPFSQEPMSATQDILANTPTCSQDLSYTKGITSFSQDPLPVSTYTMSCSQDQLPVSTDTTFFSLDPLPISTDTTFFSQDLRSVSTDTMSFSQDPLPVSTSFSQDLLSGSTDPMSFSQDPLPVSTDTTSFSQDPLQVSTDTTSFSQDPLPVSTDPMSFSQDPLPVSTDTTSFSQDPLPVSTDTTSFSQDPLPVSTSFSQDDISIRSDVEHRKHLALFSRSFPRISNQSSHTPRPLYKIFANDILSITTNTSPFSQNRMSFTSDLTPYSQDCMPITTDTTPFSQNDMPITTDATPFSHDSMPITTYTTPFSQDPMPITTHTLPFSRYQRSTQPDHACFSNDLQLTVSRDPDMESFDSHPSKEHESKSTDITVSKAKISSKKRRAKTKNVYSAQNSEAKFSDSGRLSQKQQAQIKCRPHVQKSTIVGAHSSVQDGKLDSSNATPLIQKRRSQSSTVHSVHKLMPRTKSASSQVTPPVPTQTPQSTDHAVTLNLPHDRHQRTDSASPSWKQPHKTSDNLTLPQDPKSIYIPDTRDRSAVSETTSSTHRDLRPANTPIFTETSVSYPRPLLYERPQTAKRQRKGAPPGARSPCLQCSGPSCTASEQSVRTRQVRALPSAKSKQPSHLFEGKSTHTKQHQLHQNEAVRQPPFGSEPRFSPQHEHTALTHTGSRTTTRKVRPKSVTTCKQLHDYQSFQQKLIEFAAEHKKEFSRFRGSRAITWGSSPLSVQPGSRGRQSHPLMNEQDQWIHEKCLFSEYASASIFQLLNDHRNRVNMLNKFSGVVQLIQCIYPLDDRTFKISLKRGFEVKLSQAITRDLLLHPMSLATARGERAAGRRKAALHQFVSHILFLDPSLGCVKPVPNLHAFSAKHSACVGDAVNSIYRDRFHEGQALYWSNPKLTWCFQIARVTAPPQFCAITFASTSEAYKFKVVFDRCRSRVSSWDLAA